jgi:hypothetical protein
MRELMSAKREDCYRKLLAGLARIDVLSDITVMLGSHSE